MGPLYADGMSDPRISLTGGPLPGSRVVSRVMHPDQGFHDHAGTLMIIAWGQFMDHDYTLTATPLGTFTNHQKKIIPQILNLQILSIETIRRNVAANQHP